MSYWKTINQRHGFTLLELIISMFIFVSATAVLAAMFYYFFNSFTFSFEQTKTISEIKVVTQDIFSQLREARVSEDGAYPLFIANDDEIGFYADIDKNGRIEKVRYFLEGNNFYRGVIIPDENQNPYEHDNETVVLISDKVVNGAQPVFYYYNENYPIDTSNNPLVSGQRLLNTRLVEVSLSLNTADNLQEPIEVSTQVMLRNLKTNY